VPSTATTITAKVSLGVPAFAFMSARRAVIMSPRYGSVTR
jgi:hypothetical protein